MLMKPKTPNEDESPFLIYPAQVDKLLDVSGALNELRQFPEEPMKLYLGCSIRMTSEVLWNLITEIQGQPVEVEDSGAAESEEPVEKLAEFGSPTLVKAED